VWNLSKDTERLFPNILCYIHIICINWTHIGFQNSRLKQQWLFDLSFGRRYHPHLLGLRINKGRNQHEAVSKRPFNTSDLEIWWRQAKIAEIQGIYKRMVRFKKLINNLFLTLQWHNIHYQQRKLSKFFMRYQQFAFMRTAGPTDQFPRWRRSRRRFPVCSVLSCPDLWLQFSLSFVDGLKKDIILVWWVVLPETHAAL
jgi:hypothetical protein